MQTKALPKPLMGVTIPTGETVGLGHPFSTEFVLVSIDIRDPLKVRQVLDLLGIVPATEQSFMSSRHQYSHLGPDPIVFIDKVTRGSLPYLVILQKGQRMQYYLSESVELPEKSGIICNSCDAAKNYVSPPLSDIDSQDPER